MRVQELGEITSDPDAFERFYRQHVETVQRFVARRVDDPYVVADLTADVFVAVIESASSYRRSRGEPVAWLYGIARNVVADERRRNAKELRTVARIRGRELVDVDDLAALHERIDGESAARELHRGLTRLPAGERAVLELISLDGLSVVIVRQAGESGQLYGSVSARDVSDAVTAAGFTVTRGQVVLDKAIKTLGIYKLRLVLHPEVSVHVNANVAQSVEEAEMQAKGVDPLRLAAEAAAREAAEAAAAVAPAEGSTPG